MNCKPQSAPVNLPRNMKQLRNLRYKHLNQTRISSDAMHNLHEIAYDIPGFTWKITTFPDLTYVCGLQEILEEADNVITLGSTGQLLSYDTTFPPSADKATLRPPSADKVKLHPAPADKATLRQAPADKTTLRPPPADQTTTTMPHKKEKNRQAMKFFSAAQASKRAPMQEEGHHPHRHRLS